LFSCGNYSNNFIITVIEFVCVNIRKLKRKRSLEDLFNHRLSPGTLFNFNKSCYENLEETEEIIKEQLISSSILHNDESGMNVNKDRLWLHTAGNKYWTHYACHPKRGKEAMDDIGILPFFQGTSQHDFWKSYLKYDNCKHALCGAHHLRDLEYIYERYEQPWAKAMKKLLCEIKEKVDSVKEHCDHLDEKTISEFQRQYYKIIDDGYSANPPPEQKDQKPKRGRPKRGEPLNLLDRFLLSLTLFEQIFRENSHFIFAKFSSHFICISQ